MPQPPSHPGSLAGVQEIAELAGVTKQRANQIADNKGFPAPRDKIAAGRIWDRGEVIAYFVHTRRRRADEWPASNAA